MLNFSLALASAFKARAFFRCSCRYSFWLRFFRLIPGTYFLKKNIGLNSCRKRVSSKIVAIWVEAKLIYFVFTLSSLIFLPWVIPLPEVLSFLWSWLSGIASDGPEAWPLLWWPSLIPCSWSGPRERPLRPSGGSPTDKAPTRILPCVAKMKWDWQDKWQDLGKLLNLPR